MDWWRSVRHSWSKFCSLSLSERRWLIESFLLLPLTALTLRFFGLKCWQQILSSVETPQRGVSTVGRRSVETPRRGVSTTQRVQATVRMVKAAARHGLYRPTCLEQSCVLWWLLRRQGIQSDLRIGIRRETDRVAAHAWVEHQGIAINDNTNVHDRFSAFEHPLVSAKENSV
ncbi:MAG: lasso peptide biosynthesis B2 protein [Acidobacteria bacterium]|nr:lasso peptide biosynthesis B2 protein [Acidobacteriota bacterium]